uniref:Uncharacterized protein n=1 Tax=Oryza barthii TaxID=65489 RepID=A0A0D3F5M1_9ORYZ
MKKRSNMTAATDAYVSAGMKCEFIQEVVAINTREKHFCSLGKIKKHLIGTTDIDNLLDK